jgi:hypothetical protein
MGLDSSPPSHPSMRSTRTPRPQRQARHVAHEQYERSREPARDSHDSTLDALSAMVDERYQPTWDHGRGEFTWGFELDEPHPRGQYNGTMAAAQVATEHVWSRLATVGPGARFTEPTVIDVDFPTVALSEAWWDAQQQTLFVTPEPINERASGESTTFRVVNVPDPTSWRVELEDGSVVEATATADTLQVHTTSAPRQHRIKPASRT